MTFYLVHKLFSQRLYTSATCLRSEAQNSLTDYKVTNPLDQIFHRLLQAKYQRVSSNRLISYNKRIQNLLLGHIFLIIAAAASEPEANERGSSLIGKRTTLLCFWGLQSLFFTKCKELWSVARSKAQGIVVMREWKNQCDPSVNLIFNF